MIFPDMIVAAANPACRWIELFAGVVPLEWDESWGRLP
jgi:hypothetical protein